MCVHLHTHTFLNQFSLLAIIFGDIIVKSTNMYALSCAPVLLCVDLGNVLHSVSYFSASL